MTESKPQNNTDLKLLAKCCTIGVASMAVLGAAVGSIATVAKARPRRRKTMFGTAWRYDTKAANGNNLRLLVVDGACQGASYHGEMWNHLPFEYFRGFDRMFATDKHVGNVLMIGGGAFTYPKHLLTRRPDVSMDVVEPDGGITAIALKEFHLDRLLDECPDRINIIQTGGSEWLESTDKKYDAIVNDAFTGYDPVREMVSPEFVRLAKEHLTPGGMYLANVVTYPGLEDYSHLACAKEALEGEFEYVQIIPTTDEEHSSEENFLVIASDTPLKFTDAIG